MGAYEEYQKKKKKTGTASTGSSYDLYKKHKAEREALEEAMYRVRSQRGIEPEITARPDIPDPTSYDILRERKEKQAEIEGYNEQLRTNFIKNAPVQQSSDLISDMKRRNSTRSLTGDAQIIGTMSKKKAAQEALDRLNSEYTKKQESEYYASIPSMEDYSEISNRGINRRDNKVTHPDDYTLPGSVTQRMPLSTNDEKASLRRGDMDGLYMSDDEKGIYSYLLEKYGREKADAYKNTIQESINYRIAEQQFGQIKGKRASEMLSAVESGLSRFMGSVDKLGNLITGDKALPVSSSEFKSSLVREDLNKGPKLLGSTPWQIAYDLIENTSNMAPSMVLPYGPGVSAAVLGTSAGASSANEAWRDGYGKAESVGYGIVNGISEGGLQYLLGGISKYGGKLTGVSKRMLTQKVDSAVSKALINTGVSAGSEGIEEYLQEVIDPAVRNMMLGEDNKINFLSEEALYSGLIGALSGSLLESAGNVSEAKFEKAADNAYTNIGNELSADQIESLTGYAEVSEDESLKSALEEFNTNPTARNAGALKVEVDRSVGEAVADMINTGHTEIIDSMDDNISAIADEAMEEIRKLIKSDDNNNDEVLSKTLKEFSDSANDALITSAEGSVVDPITYKNAFANYYAYGKAGVSFDTAVKNATYQTELTESQKRLAYESGVNDRRINSAKTVNTGKGMLRYINDSETTEGITVPKPIKELDSRQKESVMALRTIADITGQNIVIYQSEAVNGKVTAPNGWYSKNNDTIYIDINAGDVAENAMLRTASHEITHYIKEWSPEKYRVLQDYVIGQFETDGTIDTMIQEEIRIAKSNGRTITYEEAMDEITANSCESMLRDTTLIERMASEEPTVYEKIKLVIGRIVDSIKKAYEGLRSGSAEHKRLSEILDDWSGIQKLWDDAAVDAAKKSRNAKSEESKADNDVKNNKYSSRNFDDIQFEEKDIVYIDDKEFARRALSNNSKYSDVRKKVEQILRDIAEQYPYINNKDTGEKIFLDFSFADEYANSKDSLINNNTRKNAKMNGAKYVKQIIENAKYYNHSESKKQKGIDDSKGYNYYKVLFGLKNESGYAMYSGTLVARINSKGEVYAYDIIKLSADYGSQTQSPGKEPLSADNEIKISQEKKNVNNKFSYRDNTGRELSPEQAEYFKDSKVRDEDDNLKVVYHGTDSDFNAFSYDYIGKNGSAEGYGFYFADSREKAAGYSKGGRNIKELYLDIKNPLSSEEVTLKRSDIKKLIKEIDPTGDEIISNYESTGRGYPSKEWYNRGLEETIDILFENSSDLDIICELGNAYDVKDINEAVYDILGYDGYIEKSKYEDEEVYVAFKSSQVKNIDNLNPTDDEDIRYSYRDDTRSDREILADALMSATKNEAERKELEAYKKIIGTLDMQERLRREKVKLRNAAETAQERDRYQAQIDAIDKKIAYNDKKLIQMEAAAPLRAVIKREVKANTEHDIEYLKARHRENADRKAMTTLRTSIKNNSNSIITMLIKPTNQRHVPEGLKAPVKAFLESIDFISAAADPASFNTMQWNNRMNELHSVISHPGEDYIDFDPDLLTRMFRFTHDEDGNPLPETKLTSMDMSQLEELYIIVRSLRMGISNANRMFANKRSENAEKLGYSTIRYLESLQGKNPQVPLIKQMNNLLNVDMLDANSFFKMLGENGESIYSELVQGWKVRTNDIRESQEYMKEIYETLGITDEDLKEISGKDSKIHTFEIRGKKIDMTTAQIMSLYELNKRNQATKHIYTGGIKIDAFKHGMVEYDQTVSFKVSESDIDMITSVLTESQKALADSMQRYMANQCADKGNETSMLMYGYKKFLEKNYFPISVDKSSTETKNASTGSEVSLRAIINTGMTKNLNDKAKNPLVVRDIFDVFTDHVVDIANYHGYAAPITDSLKWFNNKYVTGDEYSTVKEQIQRVYGKEYLNYFTNLLRDINEDNTRKLASTIPEKFISAYKSAAVGGNIRVVVQQPTAYVRAATLMDIKYLAKALKMKSESKEAIEYSSLAWWKSQGYYDTGIGKSLKNVITGNSSFRDKIIDKSMALAGKADEWTWGKIWTAVKLEVADQNKALDTNSDEYMQKVTERFDQIIDETQVIDTVFAKSQIMRHKDGLHKMLTSFMAEPIKSYNMLRKAYITKNPSDIVRAPSVFLVNAVVTSAFSAVIDSFRALSNDDDREKDWTERFFEKFGDNMLDNALPVNLIPYVKELSNIIMSAVGKGYASSNRQEIVWMDSLIKSCTEIVKYMNGESKKKPMDIVKMCTKAVSQITGVPAYNIYRDIFEIPYNTVRYKMLGEESMNSIARKAVIARMDGDVKGYAKIIDDLEAEGYTREEILKSINSETTKINKSKKEAATAKEEGSEDEYNSIIEELSEEGLKSAKESIDSMDVTKEERERSIYKTSDIVSLVNANDISGANEIIADIFNVDLKNADTTIKDYKYETFKKTKSKIKAVLTKEYKSIDNLSDRIKYGTILKKITLEKQYIYTDKDLSAIEKAIAKEKNK